MHIKLVNNKGVIKKCKVGFSWTTFFWGCMVPLARGDMKYFIMTFLLQIFTLGVGVLVFGFFYNKLYIQMLINKGYKPYREEDEKIMLEKEIIVSVE